MPEFIDTFTTMTWNIHHKAQGRLQGITAALQAKSLGSDLVCLQECSGWVDGSIANGFIVQSGTRIQPNRDLIRGCDCGFLVPVHLAPYISEAVHSAYWS